MDRVLSGPWNWSFYITSLVARLPLSFLPVIILLGTLDKGVASAGTTLSAVAIGAALAGVTQGPLWDRLPREPFMLGLSSITALLLILFAFLPDGALALAVIALYGFFRPQMSTVTRSVWMQRFAESSSLSSKSISLDIASTPVIAVVAPLLAGVSFSAFGYKTSLVVLSLLVFAASLLMIFLMKINPGAAPSRTSSSMFDSIRNFFTHAPLATILVLAAFSASATGVVTILLSANLESRGELGLLSPMLALGAAAVIFGAYLFKRFIETPGNYLHIFLLIESMGLFLYSFGFASQLPVLWAAVFLGGLAAAPLGTILYILIESRSRDGDRAAAFSFLATSQFLGVSLGQLIFSRIAESLSVEGAMLIAAGVQLMCFFAWISLPYGMKRYRLQKTFSWWPENLEATVASAGAKQNIHTEEALFAQIKPYLQNDLSRGEVPDLPRSLRAEKKERQDPVLVGISKIAWNEAWREQRPTLQHALRCGEWLDRNRFASNQIENIALHLGFEHRDFIEEEVSLEDWENYSDKALLFAAIFHASRLRGSRMYERMNQWYQTPLFRRVDDKTINKILAMLSQSAIGKTLDRDDYEDLWQQGLASQRMPHLFIMLDILNLSLDQPGHPEMLLEKSRQYLDMEKDYGKYVIWFFRARAERLLGYLDEAKKSILASYDHLPFSENHDSNAFFVEQFDIERMMIDTLLHKRNQNKTS